MIKFIEKKLSTFRHCFSRTSAQNWFFVVIIGLMTRTDFLGVTSIIRGLGFLSSCYEKLIHFFRSESYATDEVRRTWFHSVHECGHLFRFEGRAFLIGDGTKQSKEGRYMPGVKKLYQESENSSKPEYIFGHMFGGIGVLLNRNDTFFCTPLDIRIHDGLSETATWSGGELSRTASHVIQMIRNAHRASETFGPSYLALDRYFLTVPLLEELDSLNASAGSRLDIITRAKNSCVAYRMPDRVDEKRRGRPRKKGEAVHLNTLFQTERGKFKEAEVCIYGKKETVKYLCLDLLWGAKCYKKLRFVLVISSRGNSILVTTDLTLSPQKVIEAYALRFKIECAFREFKQQVGGFLYHFWTKATIKLNRFRKKKDLEPLAQITDPDLQERILKTVGATERFVLFSSIAMGLSQMIALDPALSKIVRDARYLRTKPKERVSEGTVLDYLRKNIFRLLHFSSNSEITRLILRHQDTIFCDLDSEQ